MVPLNERSFEILQSALRDQERLQIRCDSVGGAAIYDFGVEAAGGLAAGKILANCTTGGLADISIVPQQIGEQQYSSVQIQTDLPLWSCIGSQYAGWPVQHGDFFAMASGPIRALRGKEAITEEFELTESSTKGVICLESSRLPLVDTVKHIAEEAKIETSNLAIAIAPTSSIAGSAQVVARSLETALHKLHEIGFDIKNVRSGLGTAPLPPIASDDLKGIGLTNDSILFGGMVELWVEAEPAELEEIGPKVPSSNSADYGTPFYDLFKDKQFDFYKIDPLLFSPACVRFHNLKTGSTIEYGKLNHDLLHQSFGF